MMMKQTNATERRKYLKRLDKTMCVKEKMRGNEKC